jgi:hypothetical protein
LFLNLYVLHSPDFADHNFGELGGIHHDPEFWVRGCILNGYTENGPWMEPYFFDMVRLTLSPGAAAAYIRTHPSLPITERDCSLSKVFQFVYTALEARFNLPEHSDPNVRLELEDVLDDLPASVLMQLPEFDWEGIFWDVLSGDLQTVVSRIRKRIQIGFSGRYDPVESPRRKRGPKADAGRHTQIADIVRRAGPDWREDQALKKICESLDKSGIKVSPSWNTWKPPVRKSRRALEMRKHDVIKALQYSLDRAPST